MWAVALVYFGAIFLVVIGLFALVTWLVFRGDDDELEAQIAEDTCRKHGILCCSRCFDTSGCWHPLDKRWFDAENGEEFCECGATFVFDHERVA